MNKVELITKMAEIEGTTKKAAGEHLDALVATISEALAKGEEVKISGFGTFSVSERAARTGRNPMTGEEQTSVLIDAATSQYNLAKMFSGGCPLW